MKKLIFPVMLCLLATAARAQNANRCGNFGMMQRIKVQDPAFAARRAGKLLADQQVAEQRAAARQKSSTAQYPIPVAFHVLVSPAQYDLIGGDTGLIRRVNSQLAVLNADYSATNSDLNLVPAPFVPVIGNLGIQFRLASSTSDSAIAPGIERKRTTQQFDDGSSYADAKRLSQGGLDGWDYTRNLNIWVVNTGSTGTLGVCVPPSIVGAQNTIDTFALADLGVAVSFTAFGHREFGAQYFFPSTNDLGRTLTHEVGHYFELEHTFGDDYNCAPDDGIADTPPQEGPSWCMPNCPAFPYYDGCSAAGTNGVMFMNYMDYVDDAAMMLFTQGQAARAQLYVAPGGESYSLTQQPLGVSTTEAAVGKIAVLPNPATGIFRIENNGAHTLSYISLLDQTGRVLYQTSDLVPQESRVVDASSFAKGLYFLKATNGSQTFTQKLVLQ